MDALTNRGTSGLLLVGLVFAGLGCLHPAGAAPAALDPYPYVSRLRAPRAPERARAARILGYLGDERHVPALADVLLRDRGRDPRTAAAVALGQIGGEVAAAALSTELLGLLHAREPIPTTDGGWAYLEAVVGATGLAGGPQALAPLRECLESPEPRLRELALAALGAQGSEEALGLVAAGLGDRNAECRVTAARALAAHGTAAQVPQLVAALRAATDDGWGLELLNALSGISTPEAVAGLAAGTELPLPVVRREAATLLGQQGGPEVVPLLDKLCDDPAALVHEGALPALARVAPERARTRLGAALQAADEPTVRGACLAAAVMDETSVADELAALAQNRGSETATRAECALLALSPCEATSRALLKLFDGLQDRGPLGSSLLGALTARTDRIASERVWTHLVGETPRRSEEVARTHRRQWGICCADEWLGRCADMVRSGADAQARDRALQVLAATGSDEALELLRQAAAEPREPSAMPGLLEAIVACPRPEATDLLLAACERAVPNDLATVLYDMAVRDARCLAYVAGMARLTTDRGDIYALADDATIQALARRGVPSHLAGADARDLHGVLLDWAMRRDGGEGYVLWMRSLTGAPEARAQVRHMLRLDEEWGEGGVKPQGNDDTVRDALLTIERLPASLAAPAVCEFLQRVAEWRAGSETWNGRGWSDAVGEAVAATGILGDPRALPLVAEALGDSSPELRRTALTALVAIGPELAEPLRARAGRENPSAGTAPYPAVGESNPLTASRTDFELLRLRRDGLGGPTPRAAERVAWFEARGMASQAERARRWAAWEADW